MDRLRESLKAAPVVDRGEYQYFVHPVSDGIPLVEPGLLQEIAKEIVEAIDLDGIDKIVTAEAMGIHIATAVSIESGVPFVIARKREYGFEDEVAVHQETGYGESELYVNFVEPGDRVIILDDVLSTGDTLDALSQAVTARNANIEDIIVVIRRTGDNEIPSLPVPPKHLIEIDVVDGEVVIIDEAT